MSSFWDNNKDTFKSVGKKTAVGIGRGTKAVSKAGQSAYKNHKDGKSLRSAGHGGEDDDEYIPEARPVSALKDVKSFPAPPKRNVPTFAIPEHGSPSAYRPYVEAAASQNSVPTQSTYQQPQAQSITQFEQAPHIAQGVQYQQPLPQQQQAQTVPQYQQQYQAAPQYQPQPEQYEQSPVNQYQQPLANQQYQQPPVNRYQQPVTNGQYQQSNPEQQPQIEYQAVQQPVQQSPVFQPPQAPQRQLPPVPDQQQPRATQNQPGITMDQLKSAGNFLSTMIPSQNAGVAQSNAQQPGISVNQAKQLGSLFVGSQSTSNGQQPVVSQQGQPQTDNGGDQTVISYDQLKKFGSTALNAHQQYQQLNQPTQQPQPPTAVSEYKQAAAPQYNPAQSQDTQNQYQSVPTQQYQQVQPQTPQYKQPVAQHMPVQPVTATLTYENPYHPVIQSEESSPVEIPPTAPQYSRTAVSVPQMYVQPQEFAQPQASVVSTSSTISHIAQNIPASPEYVDKKPAARPLPDPTSFAPPPIHKGRGQIFEPKPDLPSRNSTTSTQDKEPSEHTVKMPSKKNYFDIDVNKYGPPPPKPFGSKVEFHPVGRNSASSKVVQAPPPATSPRSNSAAGSILSKPSREPTPVKVVTPKAEISSFIPLPEPYGAVSQNSQPVGDHKAELVESESFVQPPVTHKKPPPKPSKKPSSLQKPKADDKIKDEVIEATAQLSKASISNSYTSPNFSEEIAALKKTKPVPAPELKRDFETQNKEINVKLKPKPKPKPVVQNHPVEEFDVASLRSGLKKTAHKDLFVDASESFDEEPKVESKKIPPPIKSKKPAPKPKPKPVTIVSEAQPEPVPTAIIPPPAPPSRTKIQIPVAPPSRTIITKALEEEKEPEINYELETGWFMSNQGMELPNDLKGLNFKMVMGSSGSKNFKIIAFRLRNLSTLKVKVEWNGNSIESAQLKRRYTPPPAIPSREKLISNNVKYGEYIANWCEVKLGTQVGNGECWTLAHDALEKGCGKHAFVSSGLIHGALLFHINGSDTGPIFIHPPLDELRRGDILQFNSCSIKNGGTFSTIGMPDHTVIVLGKEADKLIIIQQNVNGVKKVMKGEISLRYLISGDVKAYRAMDSEWTGELDTDW